MHLPFNFGLLSTSWDAPSIAQLIAEYEAALPAGGWPNWVLGNHDQSRIATPKATARAGAHYLVVGRPITAATDPVDAARAILAEIGA